MKHEASRELFSYWNKLRGTRTAPERGDIDPAAIRTVLADTFMLDVDARFPLRLAGTRVNALFDAGPKVSSFLDVWRASERHNVAAVLLAVADGATPVVVGAQAAPRGESPCAFELLFLPLRHFGQTHARLLGIVTAAPRPDWLGLAPMGPLTLRTLRIVHAEEADHGSERRGAKRLDAERTGVERRNKDWQTVEVSPGWSASDPRVTGPDGEACELALAGRIVQARPNLRLIEGGRGSP